MKTCIITKQGDGLKYPRFRGRIMSGTQRLASGDELTGADWYIESLIKDGYAREKEAFFSELRQKAKSAISKKKAEANIDITTEAAALAEDNEVDLSEVQGSGSGGRILKRDIEALID